MDLLCPYKVGPVPSHECVKVAILPVVAPRMISPVLSRHLYTYLSCEVALLIGDRVYFFMFDVMFLVL